MDSDLAQKAIDLALSGNWKEAIEINKQILKISPQDVDALNRLARAYAEIGNIGQAKATCQKALKIDPVNTIAGKSLVRWKTIKGKTKHVSAASFPEAFLEEPGKTKIVDLLHPGPTNILGRLDAGDEVKLVFHPHRVNVLSLDDKYIGRLSDDLAARLKSLTESGYKYRTLVKSIWNKEVKIFIREIERPLKLQGTPSFPPERIEYTSFTPPELVHKKEELMVPEEEQG